MLKSILILPDGTEVSSGVGTVNALQSVSLTQQVNTGTELTIGSACANMLEATLITPQGGYHIAAGTEIALYKEENGSRVLVGRFVAETPVCPSANICKITAYDKVSLLDRDLTQWLESLDGWPYKLLDLAKMVCAACNVSLINETIPNEDWEIGKFTPSGITGRRLMEWVGQACGRFCRATPNGEIELAWYTPKDVDFSGGSNLYIHQASFADYQVAPIDKVQIRMTDADVGVIYGSGSNGYVITGNYLLASDKLEPLQKVAEVLYDNLRPVIYTPCKLQIPATTAVWPGDILQLQDRNGRKHTVYVMSKVQSGALEILECTGGPNRATVTVTNSTKLSTLGGKVLELQMSVEGLKAENRDRDGKSAALELTVEGIKTGVTAQQTQLQTVESRVSTVEQTADGLSLQVGQIVSDGASKVSTVTGYTFDQTGMTVEKTGGEIKTQITEDGMRVFKNGSGVLTANSAGVDAVDLKASTYLVVGDRSRFENYGPDRTGCFWIGG